MLWWRLNGLRIYIYKCSRVFIPNADEIACICTICVVIGDADCEAYIFVILHEEFFAIDQNDDR